MKTLCFLFVTAADWFAEYELAVIDGALIACAITLYSMAAQ